MKHYCNYCDPKYFIVYGFCQNCQRRCEPPLFDKDTMDFDEYDKMRIKWRSEKADLILDEMRRREKE